jgi:hypothetical protein
MSAPEPGERNRSANTKAGLILSEGRLRRLPRFGIGSEIAVVEPRVRIQCVVPQIEVAAAVELIGSRARDHPDVGGSLTAAIGAIGGGGHRDFFDGIQARIQPREEPICGLQPVVLDVHAVERDVDRALWQSVDR